MARGNMNMATYFPSGHIPSGCAFGNIFTTFRKYIVIFLFPVPYMYTTNYTALRMILTTTAMMMYTIKTTMTM